MQVGYRLTAIVELMIYITGSLVLLASLTALTCWALKVIYRSVRSLIKMVRQR